MQNIETFSFSVGYAKSTPEYPNRIRRSHGLEHWMLELTVGGYADVETPDGDKVTFTKGDIFCYHPETPQYYELQPGCKMWRHYWICFYPTEEVLSLLNWKKYFDGFQGVSIRDGTILARIESVFKQALSVARSHHMHRNDLMNNLLEQILLWAKMDQSSNSLFLLDERVRKSLYHIDASLERYIKIDELAKVAGLSVSRFAHLFQNVMGVSPLRYLERRRMERAVEYLLTTSEPISQIAGKVGYDDPLYFSRVFHRIVGASPKSYRSGERNSSRRKKDVQARISCSSS